LGAMMPRAEVQRLRPEAIHPSAWRDCMKSSASAAPRVLFVDAWPQK
jgi:hypothetical protein